MRMMKKLQAKYVDLQNGIITKESFNQSSQSYFGLMKHCEAYNLRRKLRLIFEVHREYD